MGSDVAWLAAMPQEIMPERLTDRHDRAGATEGFERLQDHDLLINPALDRFGLVPEFRVRAAGIKRGDPQAAAE